MENTLGLALAAMVTATAAQSSTVTISLHSVDVAPEYFAFSLTLDLDVFGSELPFGSIHYSNYVNPRYEDLTIRDVDGVRIVDATQSYEYGNPSQYPELVEQIPGLLYVHGSGGSWLQYDDDGDVLYENFGHDVNIYFDENGEVDYFSTTYDDLLNASELMVTTTYVYDDPVTPVPLPAGGLLLVTGLFGLGAWRRISGAA